jgi:hypothetical protein
MSILPIDSGLKYDWSVARARADGLSMSYQSNSNNIGFTYVSAAQGPYVYVVPKKPRRYLELLNIFNKCDMAVEFEVE